MADGRCPSCLHSFVGVAAKDEPVSERLASQLARQSHASEHKRNQAGRRNIAIGIVLLGGGIAATVLSYLWAASSPGGGVHVIFYGAMIVGVIQILRGVGELGRRG